MLPVLHSMSWRQSQMGGEEKIVVTRYRNIIADINSNQILDMVGMNGLHFQLTFHAMNSIRIAVREKISRLHFPSRSIKAANNTLVSTGPVEDSN